MNFFLKYFGSVLFSVFPNVCAHLIKVGNNHFTCVQTKFGKYTIFGENTQFWSLEYTNRKFGVGRSAIDIGPPCTCACKKLHVHVKDPVVHTHTHIYI